MIELHKKVDEYMKAYRYLVLYLIINILLPVIYGCVYKSIGYDNISDLIVKNRLYMAIILGLIFIPLLVIAYKKYNIKSQKIDIKMYLYIVILNTIYNFLAFNLNKYFMHSNLYDVVDFKYSLISTVLIGPIIEEVMFRGIMYNELKKRYSVNKSILITTLIFSLMHLNIIQVIYAFILGYILNRIYEKNKNMTNIITLHMLSNFTATIVSALMISFIL